MEASLIWERNMDMWTKESIRKQVFAKRRFLGEHPCEEQERNRRLRQQVLSVRAFQEAEEVYLYASYHHEADTMELARIWLKQGKRLAYPRVEGREMAFYWICSLEDLEPGCKGILEPSQTCVKAENGYAPMLVPGVAFDRMGGRVGYGGGYYDRFFEREPKHFKAGYAFSFQIFETVPRDRYDICMDVVLTEP